MADPAFPRKDPRDPARGLQQQKTKEAFDFEVDCLTSPSVPVPALVKSRPEQAPALIRLTQARARRMCSPAFAPWRGESNQCVGAVNPHARLRADPPQAIALEA